MLTRLDEKILSICTAFAHWFQRLTGRTNFFIAKMGIFITVSATMVRTANYFHNFLSFQASPISLSLYVIINVFYFRYACKCDQAENEALASDVRARHFNLGKSWRMVWFFATLFSVGDYLLKASTGGINIWTLEAISSMFAFGVCIFEYFVDVNPLPPGKSKVRKWIENFAAGFRKPEPAPASK